MADEKKFAPKTPDKVEAPAGFVKKHYKINHCLGDKKLCFSISGDTGDKKDKDGRVTEKAKPFNLSITGNTDQVFSFPGYSADEEAFLVATVRAHQIWIDVEVKKGDEMVVERRQIPTFNVTELVEQD